MIECKFATPCGLCSIKTTDGVPVKCNQRIVKQIENNEEGPEVSSGMLQLKSIQDALAKDSKRIQKEEAKRR